MSDKFSIDAPKMSIEEAKVLLPFYLKMAQAIWEVLPEDFDALQLVDKEPEHAFIKALNEEYGLF